MESSQVAVVGLGRMGSAMAATLSRAGFEVVVWNRSGDTAVLVAGSIGGAIAKTPREAAASAPIVLTSLADDQAVRDVYLGDDGITAGIQPGSVAVEMSTVDPSVLHEIGALVDAVGADLLDAPGSGSVQLVEQGNLTIMAGGTAEAVSKAQPVLDALAARVFHVGNRGAGATIKLAVNALVHGLNGALAEALVLAEAAGVDRSSAYEVFAAGAGGAPFVQYKRAAYEDPDAAPVAFSLDLVAKDLDLITALGARSGVEMPVSHANLKLARQAIAAGLGDRDMSALAVYLRDTQKT